MNNSSISKEAKKHMVIPRALQKAKPKFWKVLCSGKEFQEIILSSEMLFYGVHNTPHSLRKRWKESRLRETGRNIHYILRVQGGKLCVQIDAKERNYVATNQWQGLITSFINVGGRDRNVFQGKITHVQLCEIGRKLSRPALVVMEKCECKTEYDKKLFSFTLTS